MGDPDQLFTYKELTSPPPGTGGKKMKQRAVNDITAIDDKDIARVIIVVRTGKTGGKGAKKKYASP
jgi:hypothetical protein